MYELKEEDYNKLLKCYDKKVEKTPFGEAVKNKISPFFVVYQDGHRISNFVVYKNDDNWLAFDREILKDPKLMNFILEKLKPKYEYLTIYINQKDKNLINEANSYGFEETEKYREDYINMKKTF